MYLVKFLVVVMMSSSHAMDLNLFKLFTKDDKIWKCVTELNEDCVNSISQRPVRELFDAKEIQIGDFISIEKLNDTTKGEEREVLEDIWDLDDVWKAGSQYVQDRALKLKFGGLEARMFQSKSKPDNVELVLEARRRDTGKGQKIYRVIIPLIVGFKITGIIIFSIVAVKLFLLKASLIANTALLVAGGIVMKKLYDHGMGLMTQHQAYLNSHQPLPNFYAQNHDFSGYGYNGYSNNAYEQSNNLHSEVADPLVPELGDLQGQFSDHAIALAALNKTLMQQQQHTQQQPLQMPKRRWTHRWNSFR